MNWLSATAQAIAGLWRLVLHRPGWREAFAMSLAGLRAGVGLYLGAIVLNIAAQAIVAPDVSVVQIVVNVVANLAPLLALLAGIAATLVVLRPRVSPYDLLVPAVYGLAVLLLLGIPLSVMNLPAGPLLLVGIGYVLFRIGREAAGFSRRTSIAFAVLCVVLLVAVPLSLYMVLAPGPGPI